jgi:hypothetical protein
MLQKLVDHSTDLQKLRDNGYELQWKGGHLLVHHVPYVNSQREVKFGTLVTELTLNGNRTHVPNTHVIHWIGEQPCDKNGNVISSIQHNNATQQLFDGVIINYSFSNKPANGYADYYEKITTYLNIISAEAKSIDKTVTACTFKVFADEDEDGVFHYYDTNSSRAKIQMLNAKFKDQEIAIIGLGGTGSYILDLVSKTPVTKIHLYDGDSFLQHNAFRAPGAAGLEDFPEEAKAKVDYLTNIYSKMHKGIIGHSYYITEDNVQELRDYSYVFLAVDKNTVRNLVITEGIAGGLNIIDVGLGINVVDDQLIGTLRVTSFTPGKNDHVEKRISKDEDENNDYGTNIQISDLNALNAALAVIKWKKFSGFYQDMAEEHHNCYLINVSKIINDDTTA